jgi:hypothetical protein
MARPATYPRLQWRGPITHADRYADYAISADQSNECPLLVNPRMVEVRVIRLGEFRRDLFGFFEVGEDDDMATAIEIAKSHADQIDRAFWVGDQRP